MAERATRESDWGYYEGVLANAEVAVKGELACIDTATGNIVAGQTSTTLLPIGFFTASLTGDGTTKTQIRLFREMRLYWWDNDPGGTPVVAANVGSECYIKDSKSVSGSSAGSTRSKAGRVWAVSSTNGVLVEGGPAVTGPTGASGRTGHVATRTALAAIAAGSRADGDIVIIDQDGSQWYFASASALAADGLSVEGCNIVIVPGAGSGRWLRKDSIFVAKIPIAFGTADAAQLMLVPAGYSVKIVDDPSWDVTTGFTGGSSSAIGISSSNTGSSTKGDLLGGASGDVTATLGSAGVKQGTVGAKMGSFANRRACRIEATEYLRFDRITSAFTAGAGFVNVPMALEIVG